MTACREPLRLEGVWKRYRERGRWVLRGVSLSLPPGGVVGVVGANGSGKTTLLRIAAGLTLPSRGRALACGEDTRRPPARRHVGVVLHHSLLYPQLTVSENLEYYARLYGVEGYDPEGDWVVEALGLRRFLSARAGELSFGWRKRADIARALLHGPSVLLLDEPFTGLDEAGVVDVAGVLGEYASRGGAVLATAPRPGDLGALEGVELAVLRGGVLHAGGEP